MSLKRSVVYILLIIVFSFTKGFSQEVPITINVGSGSGAMGSTICVDFTVEDFMKVTSAQFVIRFDPKVLMLACPFDNSCSALNEGGMNGLSSANFNCNDVLNGFVNFTWFDLNTTGVNLDDDEVLFCMCFELIGDPCDRSEVTITESGAIPFEIAQIDCITGGDLDLIPTINPGEITIDPDGYEITTAFCSSDDSSDSGSITFAGTGGIGPYDWSIMSVGASGTGLNDCETATVENLAPGTYTITFIDANNNVINEDVTISSNSDFPFLLTLDGTNPTCFDRKNGAVEVINIEGGEAPFQYEWSTFQFDDVSIDQLGAGAYELTITDVNGCSTSSSISLNVDTLKLTFDVIADPSCDGSSDGIVSIFAAGGTPYPGNNFDFEIDGINGTIYFGGSGIPTNPFTAANLPPGCFEAIASDDASISCFSDPIEFCIEAGSFSELEININNISCFGNCDGGVEIVAGDMGNFSFMVADEDGVAITGINTNLVFEANSLCGGLYNVTVNDVNAGCSKDTFFTIIEPDLLVLSVIDSLGPGCGGGDGMITFEANGGTEDYDFLWNDSFDQPSRMDMGGGNYSVTVTDMNGCEDNISFTFADGGDIGLNAFVCSAVTCGSAMDGSVCANVSSAGTFTFSWEDADGNDLGTGMQIDNLSGGIYFVTATDGMCTDTESVFVAPGDTPSVTIVQQDPTCSDSADGRLTATLATGTNPPTFEWSKPPSTAILIAGAVFTGEVGTYNLHVTDGNGCELDTLITMTPPSNVIQIDIANIVENPCFGSCEGMATFTASGGSSTSGEYVFFVSGIDAPIDPSGDIVNVSTLCGGENWVYAIDGICASDTFFFTVPDADPIFLNETLSVIEPPSCPGDSDGSISIVVGGGNDSSYDILWINEGISGPSLTDLTSGLYVYSVTDGSNCVFLDSILLVDPDSLMLQINPGTTTNIGCNGGTTGTIGLFVTGGNSGILTYMWDPSVSNQEFASNLSEGLYSITVTDSKGCTAETSYELTKAEPIQAIINAPAEPDCFGGQTCISIDTVFGGAGNVYSFSVTNGGIRFPIDTCINVFANEYNIIVNDNTGCEFDTTIIINQPEEVIVDLGPDVTISLGDNSDPISAMIVSELDIDSIVWNPVTDLECNTIDCQIVTLSPLSTTNYTITVIDENGCLATDDINVVVDLARNVFFSNIFSPNGDNQNDLFQLATGSGVIEVSYFKLFDRWGNMVYVDEGYMPDDSLHPGWDGTVNNGNAEAGVYVYFAEVLFADNVRVLYKGDVTLIR